MLRKMVSTAVRALGRLAGAHVPRPRNLILIPSPMELERGGSVTALGRDIAEVVACCGGTLAMHRRRGGDVRVFSRSPLSDDDHEALSLLGIDPDRVSSGEGGFDEIQSSSFLLLPFPPEGKELYLLGKTSSASQPRVAFFDSRFVVLADRESRIDEVAKEKDRSLACVGSSDYRRRSGALSIYRSVSTARGEGFTEGFLSGTAGLCALGFRGVSLQASSSLRNLFYRRYLSEIFALRDAASEHRISGVSGNRTLVISPHYDDEVISAGGTITGLHEKGHEILVVYGTDGREGIPSIPDRQEVERLRREESEQALSVLGVNDTVHLGAPETRVRPSRELVSRLEGIVKEFRPHNVILPWFFDNHVDHVETNRVLARVARTLDPDTLIMGSEVWTPLPPNLTIECGAYADRKRRALACFKSQLDQVDYLRTAMALGVYRAVDAGLDGLAEAFFCLPAGLYRDRVQRSGVSSMRFFGVEGSA